MSAAIVLGVAGGIAAYKACELLRLLTESGHACGSCRPRRRCAFVGAPTWAALSGQPVATDVWTDVHEVPHVRLGQQADLVVVAPATADLLARAAHGLADDLLTNTLLTARCPVLFAPAMHTEMWEHPATVANVATLRAAGRRRHRARRRPADRRRHRQGPAARAGRDLRASPRRLLRRGAAAAATWPAGTSWSPPAAPASRSTRCASSATARPGKQGYALARAAAARGARVTLVAANVALPDPAGVDRGPGRAPPRSCARRRSRRPATPTRGDGGRAGRLPAGDVRADQKIKKSRRRRGADRSTLVTNPDIAAELGAAQARRAGARRVRRRDRATRPAPTAGRSWPRKRADLIVVNEVGVGQGLRRRHQRGDGPRRRRLASTALPEQPKDDLADADLGPRRARGCA